MQFVRVPDGLEHIRRAWDELEAVVALRGRHFYGAFDPVADDYRACVEVREGDELVPGLESGTLPGGRYLRARLRGDPPAVYERIGPTFDELTRQAEAGHEPAEPRALPPLRRDRPTAADLGRPAAARAAASGSSASRMARTTATPGAPAPTTSATLESSMPPIANHGTVRRRRRGAEELQTARDRILLRRRCERGHPDVVGAADIAELSERRDREPEQPHRARRATAPARPACRCARRGHRPHRTPRRDPAGR